MTREEAINRLRDMIIEIRTYCDESKHMSETDKQNMEALDMAIKVLEQQPCDDCVSRQAVLDLCDMSTKYKIPYEYYDDKKNWVRGWDDGRIINMTKLMRLPSVNQQEPKIGHWINQHVIYANATIDFKVCSECRYEFSYDAETGVSDANYCSNCGAKMQEVEE